MVVKFVVVGHVDVGKSSLCGQILVNSGYIEQHEFDKIKHQAERDGAKNCLFARILDIYEEERARGKTHEYSSFEFMQFFTSTIVSELIRHAFNIVKDFIWKTRGGVPITFVYKSHH